MLCLELGINKSVVDQMIEILEAESLINSVLGNFELFHADVGLVSYAITLLYNLTFEKKIFYHLKDKEVIGVCENLYEAKDKTIEFASRTLGAILNQEEIDEIDSPTRVARSFLYLIENTIDDVTLIYHGIKLDGVLSNLESMFIINKLNLTSYLFILL
jgi:predicted transcriptional regulator